MKKLLRSNSETDFTFEKKKIESLNNNLKLLKDPIINKEYQHKKLLSKRLEEEYKTQKDDEGPKSK